MSAVTLSLLTDCYSSWQKKENMPTNIKNATGLADLFIINLILKQPLKGKSVCETHSWHPLTLA